MVDLRYMKMLSFSRRLLSLLSTGSLYVLKFPGSRVGTATVNCGRC